MTLYSSINVLITPKYWNKLILKFQQLFTFLIAFTAELSSLDHLLSLYYKKRDSFWLIHWHDYSPRRRASGMWSDGSGDPQKNPKSCKIAHHWNSFITKSGPARSSTYCLLYYTFWYKCMNACSRFPTYHYFITLDKFAANFKSFVRYLYYSGYLLYYFVEEWARNFHKVALVWV